VNETFVQARVVSPSDLARIIAKDHDLLYRGELMRQAFWRGLGPEQRDPIFVAVQLHLARLLQNVEQWVPGSVQLSDAGRLDVVMSLPLQEVNTETAKRRIQEQTITRTELIDLLAETMRGIRERT